MNCFNCGQEVPEGQNFCGNCGAPQIANPGDDKEVTATAGPSSSGSKTWMWVLLGCAGLLVIACCLGIVMLFSFSSVISESAAEVFEELATIEPQLQDETLSQVATQLPEILPAPTDTAMQTERPTSTATPQFECDGLGITSKPDLPIGIVCENVPAQTENEVFGLPAHVQMKILDYPVTPSFHSPHISVFPVQEYRQLSAEADDRIDHLQDLLRRKPDQAEEPYPFLPVWNAGQMMAAQFDYLEFISGEGVRYVTQYGQAAWPINNQDLFYTFQGMTADGKYYVSAVLPVTHSQLPQDGDTYIADDYEGFIDGYAEYLDETEQQLESSASKTFRPNLLMLDALISTLSVDQ